MPYTAGVWTFPTDAGGFNTAVTGSQATPAAWNTRNTDLATGLSTCLLKDGTQIVTANIPMAAHKFTGLSAGTATTDSVQLQQVQLGALQYASNAGSAADVWVATLTPAVTALTAGLRFSMLAPSTNAGAVTINLNTLGATALRWTDDTALGAGATFLNGILEIEYNFTTGRFNLVGGAASRLPIGTAGQVIMYRSSVGTAVSAFKFYIQGLTYQNAAGDVTNDLDIAAGGCFDATNAYYIAVAALTKQSDAAWAVGTGAGMLDTGSVGNSDYYLWAIARSDTGVTDFLCSLSSTAPTMPTNYDFKRLIGWFKRSGGLIVLFKTYEGPGGALQFLWAAPTTDVSLANTLGNARRTDAIKVPLNLSVDALINVGLLDAAICFAWVYCPDQSDQAAVSDAASAPMADVGQVVASVAGYNQLTVKTSATGTIASRATLTVDQYGVVTVGFTMARRT